MSGHPAELPESVVALGEQVSRGGRIAPSPGLFDDPAVFAAENARIFGRKWLAVDHVSRLPQDGSYFAVDTAMRSIVVTREAAGRLHALRNMCLHAGYRICEGEDGAGDRLHCLYHDWEYALDGRLVYPELSSKRYDPSRLRLQRHALRIDRGLILVDPSGEQADETAELDGLPSWLGASTVSGRARYSTTWNWKLLRDFLHSGLPRLLGGEPEAPVVTFGPLSILVAGARRAALVRIIPRTPQHTDFQVIRLASPGAPANERFDALEAALRQSGDAIAGAPDRLDRDFFAWYWSLMA